MTGWLDHDKKSPEFAAARASCATCRRRSRTASGELTRLETRRARRTSCSPTRRTPASPTASPRRTTRSRHGGEKPSFAFAPKDHVELGTKLGILDFEAGAKLSGARFTVVRDAGAKLMRGLMTFMLDTHSSRGYREVWPPVLLKRECMEGTGQLPKFEDDAFKTSGEHELFLSPTAEVPLTNLHRDGILDATTAAPLHRVQPCFARRPVPRGRDTRGMIRTAPVSTRSRW